MKKIPWWSPQIGKYEYGLIKMVLESNFPNEGKMTSLFEYKIGKILKVKYVVAVNNATSAMYLSLKALGVGFGDEVIVPDLTFISTANAVEMTGAKAILVDVDPKSLTISTKSLKNAITSKTKAVIPVHVSGRAANLSGVIKIAKMHKLFVIEDAAEAFMSKHLGKFLGTSGETGCFSLSPAKTITTGQGGVIVTNNKKIYLALKELKDQGRKKRGTGGNDIHFSLGFNFKFTDLQAAVGLGQLRYLNSRVKRMRRSYTLYQKHLKGVKGISLFDVKINSGELQQWVDALTDQRDELIKFLNTYGIECRPFWYPIHTQRYYKKADDQFPSATELSPKAFWLPSGFTMKDADVIYVCKKIKLFFSHEKN